MEQTIAQLAAAFNLNNELAEQYANQYSKSVLAKALQSFEQQRTKKKITSPQRWLAWVLADEQRKEQERASRFPKNGKEAGHSTKPRNPNGHSPSVATPNAFMNDYEIASSYSEGEEYEEHLENISRDKMNPEGYKLMVRRYDYRRTARR